MDSLWESQNAVITGAATGLGAAIARYLVRKKVRLALLDINEEGLEKIRKELPSDTLTYKMDVSQKNQVKHTISDILDQYRKVDIMINSASVTDTTIQLIYLVISDYLQILLYITDLR